MHGNELDGIVVCGDKRIDVFAGVPIDFVKHDFHIDVEAFLNTGVAAEECIVDNFAGFRFHIVVAGLTVGGDNAERCAVIILGFNAVIDELAGFQRVSGFGNRIRDSFGIFVDGLRIVCGSVAAAGGHNCGNQGQCREHECGNACLFHQVSPLNLF